MTELLDGRDHEALDRELRRCATAVFGGEATVDSGEILNAVVGVAARIGEEVTRRLDRVPEKQAANFHAAMGIGRAPPVAARVPVAITLSATAPEGQATPAGTRLQATTDADPITFETLHGITPLRGSVQCVCAADLEGDRILIAPPSVATPALPPPDRIRRILASAAGAGAMKLQIEPVTGLAAGLVISFGDPALEADHEIAKVEGNLVTVMPPVETTVPQTSEVREVTQFSPWQAGARNRQSHRLYLGHSTLLDVPSATRISVSGVTSDQADIEWAWFGKLSDSDPQAAWHPFEAPRVDESGRWILDKPKGKIEKTSVEGREALWLRATLRGLSSGPKTAQSIHIAAGACENGASDPADDAGADFEAVAVTTPVVAAQPFHPFGREPRIYDSFYVGCNEVFSKAGAEARLEFTLGSAVLGAMAAVTSASSAQIFAVGTDGLLYRVRLDGITPGFETVPLPTELKQIGFSSQAAVAARIVHGRITLAVAGRGSVYTTAVDIDPGTSPGTPEWQRLAGDADSADAIVSAIFLVGDPAGSVLALCGGRLLTWKLVSGGSQLEVDESAIDLIPVQNAEGQKSVLVTTNEQFKWEVWLLIGGIDDAPQHLTTIPAGTLPETMRAAWANDKGDVLVAGFAAAMPDSAELSELQLVRLSGNTNLKLAPDSLGLHEPRPIGFEPSDAKDNLPVLVLATPVPTRIALDNNRAEPITGEPGIGASANAARRFVAVSQWTVVQHPDRGIFYRRKAVGRSTGGSKDSTAWSLLGPNQPANPELSWEYWNGSSWWALDAITLADSTADLLGSGEVTFAVPSDMAETDVGGRKNRWIRARLIGGDYGEARVTVTSKVVNSTTTKQSVSRELSAIRAPYVINLRLTYCTTEALMPEIVLAADNLGVVDQTNANSAGLPARFFLPVSAVLDPQPPQAAGEATGKGECCEQWDDRRAIASMEPAASEPLPGRVILLALDQPPKGDVVSIYIDAEPTGGRAKLAARVFRGGAFTAVEIIEDATSGLNESGTIRLRVAEAPDRTELFGHSAFWLAFAPAAAAGTWSPRLRGIHLNGVMAASAETRRNESIGSSSGAPDQAFSLATQPVDPSSIALWISEPLGAREADELGAEAAIEGMPGPWVRWARTPELPVGDVSVPKRVFTVNALTGELRFGDGRNALIPPPGSALLARAYAHVVGEAANGVAAGTELQPVSPIAGVDKVRALDLAAGGADAEPIQLAHAGAPAKLRHGDRPVTLADVEDYVTSRLPRVAQARAANRRGRPRLIIAERGETIVPAPATLRGILADIAGAAAYSVAVRLDVVGPRLLPVRVEIAIEPDRGIDVATSFRRARAAILALFDHETGGQDGRGWPIGARPEPADIAAALADLAESATIQCIAIVRAGNREPLPDPLPVDVLACTSDADVIVKPAGETVT